MERPRVDFNIIFSCGDTRNCPLFSTGLHADVYREPFQDKLLAGYNSYSRLGVTSDYIDKGVGLLSVPEYGRGCGMSLTLSD